MEILNVIVTGIEESIIAASYPMLEKPLTEEEFCTIRKILSFWINDSDVSLLEINSILKNIKVKDITSEIMEKEGLGDYVNFIYSLKEALKYFRRAINLGKTNNSEGHSCYLKGIKVSFDMKAPEWFWRQFDRYHFSDYVSSMSKMHRITRVDLNECCNEYVSKRIIEDLECHIKVYNDFEKYKEEATNGIKLRNGEIIEFTKENLFKLIVNNVPAGFELTARVETNYLQEKSKYFQRKNHKMYAWKDIYCPFLETLPLFKESCGIEEVK